MPGSAPTPPEEAHDAEYDEVLAHRARLAGYVRIGKRVGYGLFAYAIVAFACGAILGFPIILIDSIVAAMLIGSVLLIPAIVFGYGIRAADRDDRERAAARAQADSEPSSGGTR